MIEILDGLRRRNIRQVISFSVLYCDVYYLLLALIGSVLACMRRLKPIKK